MWLVLSGRLRIHKGLLNRIRSEIRRPAAMERMFRMRTRNRQWPVLWRCAVWLAWAGVTAATAQTSTLDAALAALRQAGPDIDKQAVAVRALVAQGGAAIEPLIRDLAAADRQVRVNAAMALGRLRATRAVDPLVSRLREDSDPEVRATAAEALGRIGDRRAAPVLVATVNRQDAHEMDRRGAVVALGGLRAAAGVEPLVTVLASANWEERWRAAVALGQIGDRKSRQPLEPLTRDPNPVVAGCAAWACGHLAGTPDFAALKRNLRGTDDAAAWGTAWALGVIGTPAASEALREALKDGSPAAQAAARMVLAWLGISPAEATGAGQPALAAGTGPFMELDDRWSDRYGKLDIRITEPAIVSSRVARPELGAHARPCLYPLPDGDLLLVVEPEPQSAAAPRTALRSRDHGLTWQPEPPWVNRLAAVASLRDLSVLVYDQYLFAKEASRYVSDLCVCRDGGRSFGPLLVAEFALPEDQVVRAAARNVVDVYTPSSAQWSDRSCTGLSGRVIELTDGNLVACGLSRTAETTGNRCVCYRSGDKGMTWTAVATLARSGVSGVALAVGDEGHLVALLTQGTPPMLALAFSMDGGATWTEPRSLRVPATTVSVCRLSSGVLAASYGGPGVSVMFNLDGTGKSWTDRILLVDPGEGVSGMSSFCEVGSDHLLVAYDRQGVFPEVDANPTAAVFAAYVTVTRTAP